MLAGVAADLPPGLQKSAHKRYELRRFIGKGLQKLDTLGD